jgi:ABC-2 type transport system permease protein
MSADAVRPLLIPRTSGVPYRTRLYGLGSVFGKAVRDARLPVAVVAGTVGLIAVALGSFFDTAYAANRQELTDLAANLPPIITGIFWGSSLVKFDTLGGYVSQDAQFVFKLLPGFWSILALSATLTIEARRGSLELVAAAPATKRRIAIEKLGAHVLAMTVVTAAVALALWLTGQAFGRQPIDAIPLGAAIGYGLGVGLIGLAAGSVAFAVAPFVGRSAAAGLAGTFLFASYVVDGYQASFPVLAGPARLSWFSWTSGHNPLAGVWDLGSLAVLAGVVVVLLTVGVEAFSRRDLGLGSRVGGRAPVLPDAMPGLRGPIGRSIAERLPAAVAWGAGIGIYGLMIAVSSRSFADELAKTPELLVALQGLLPTYDITTAGGVLQVTFMAFASILAGLAAATLVTGWASDETSGRLEMLLTTPLARTRWAWASGVGVYLAIAVMTAVLAVAIGVGVAAAGGDVVTPLLGTLALGLYAIALAGIGLAVGGLASTSIAGPVVAVVAVATFLLDFLVPALDLPGWMRRLALSADLGQPMVGTWGWTGVVASVTLAIGGLAIGAWGVRRRDLRL